MYKKPDCLLLYGDWGKQIYNDIINAKPLKSPLYTQKESDSFEKEFEKFIPELINSNQLAYEEN